MMTTKEQLLGFIKDFCTAAVEVARDSDAKESTLGYLSQLATVAPKLKESDRLPAAKRSPGSAGAYSPARRAVWLNRAAIGAWLGGKGNAKDADDIGVFYNTREFGGWIANFASSNQLVSWRAVHECAGIPNDGIVMHGVSGGIFWFGVRTSDEIVAAMQRSPDLFPEHGTVPRRNVGVLLRSLNAEQRAYVLQERVDSKQRALSPPLRSDRPIADVAEARESSVVSVSSIPGLIVTHTVAGAERAGLKVDGPARTADMGSSASQPGQPSKQENAVGTPLGYVVTTNFSAASQAFPAESDTEYDRFVLRVLSAIHRGIDPVPGFLVEKITNGLIKDEPRPQGQQPPERSYAALRTREM